MFPQRQQGMSETTPLLMASQPAFPGAGAFPAQGQFPGQGHYSQNQYSQNQYSMGGSSLNPGAYSFYQRYGGGHTPRPGTPIQSTKKIFHDGDLGKDPHSQFCALTGCPPTNAPPDFKYKMNAKTLYGRAVEQVRNQNFTYQLTAAATNTLLLLQIVLGAALTGLGGAGVPGGVITLFGAANTIIAGLVAYLKSRGQPMRARMFRDDLERVVDEIENSEVMWLGIAKGVHGYDDIDTEEEVTVRSEVARLTRLLDKAIKNNTQNNPDLYSQGGGVEGGGGGGGGNRNVNPYLNMAAIGGMPMDAAAAGGVPAMPTVEDADEAPTTSVKKKKDDDKDKKADSSSSDDKGKAAAATDPPTAVSKPPMSLSDLSTKKKPETTPKKEAGDEED